jgi:hypothetical protein
VETPHRATGEHPGIGAMDCRLVVIIDVGVVVTQGAVESVGRAVERLTRLKGVSSASPRMLAVNVFPKR